MPFVLIVNIVFASVIRHASIQWSYITCTAEKIVTETTVEMVRTQWK